MPRGLVMSVLHAYGAHGAIVIELPGSDPWVNHLKSFHELTQLHVLRVILLIELHSIEYLYGVASQDLKKIRYD